MTSHLVFHICGSADHSEHSEQCGEFMKVPNASGKDGFEGIIMT